MKTERSYIRLYILLILLFIFVIFYVVNKEEKKESSVDNIAYSMNLMLEEPEKEKIEKEEVIEEPVIEYEKHTGDLTGYSADCPACYGTLACKPSYKVYKNGVVTYNDEEYGKVRIVATSKKVPCGSIIKFKDTYAIVLDRGVLGYNVDLLVENEEYARKNIGRSKITYEIIRSGW